MTVTIPTGTSAAVILEEMEVLSVVTAPSPHAARTPPSQVADSGAHQAIVLLLPAAEGVATMVTKPLR